MQSLNSKNYSSVQVHLKDQTITMPADKGAALMQFLTSENNSSHVMITDTQGTQTVVNKFDIKKVAPVTGVTNYKTVAEMGMPELGNG